MDIIASVSATQEYGEESGMRYEAGTHYEIQECQECNKIVLVSGAWHDGMESEEDWSPNVLLPEPNDSTARRIFTQHQRDRECMTLAVAEARKSTPESIDKPKVGAVVVTRDGTNVTAGHRGELAPGDHAEFTILEKKCQNADLTGSTVYTTLEPCTTRNHPKLPCANRLVSRKVARVVIGMLDPDARIRGHGILALRRANIQVDLFPPDLMAQLEEMNREFILQKERLMS
jgi:pyrimidine deaminase RibD-like protein